MAADGAAPSVETVARADAALGGGDSAIALSPARRAWPYSALTFATHASPFFVAAGAYEVLRRLVQYRGEIHVGDLYALEERLFPVATSSGTVAVSEAIAAATHPLLDLVCGATYLLFLLEMFAIAAWLFFRDRPKMMEVALGFLTLNLVGWTIWLLYPAAPPWYVDLYGTGPVVLDAPSNAAGLARIDALLPFPVSAAFYSKSANVFGAMPSLHVGYATMMAYIVHPLGGKLRYGTLAFAVSMAFSAMYLRHHYLLDVLAGFAVALPVAWLVRRMAARLSPLLEVKP